jgi:CheY-like chemotaxis protein
LGTLAGGIAHDFNNIIAVMRGNLSLLETELPPPSRASNYIAELSRACTRAADLVRQILAFGRQQEQDRRVIALQPVVADALKLLRSTLPAMIHISTRFSAPLPNTLADPGQVHQVIMNLGINASHAIGSQPGTIQVELDPVQVDAALAESSPELQAGLYLRLTFSDTGAGIPEEIRERIFEPFFTTKAPGSGTGLGLSVVRGILKNHGGAITVYSRPGKGTRFNLYWPAVEAASQEAPALNPEVHRGHGQHVLYLDDEESLVTLAHRLLERLGYRVSGFSDPEQAIRAFKEAPQDFDLIVTDLSMPGVSGIDVARRMLEVRPDIPVFLTTGYVRPEDVERAHRVGVREVIWKPATVHEMASILAQHLDTLRTLTGAPEDKTKV